MLGRDVCWSTNPLLGTLRREATVSAASTCPGGGSVPMTSVPDDLPDVGELLELVERLDADNESAPFRRVYATVRRRGW